MFESGVSLGSSKTYRLDKKTQDGIIYLDTPGLADIKKREDAASAITEALRQNGRFQVFFVVTLSAGRLRPEDITTIWLVLLNAPDITSFSIIINKLSQREYDCLKDDNDKLKLLAPLKITEKNHVFLLLNSQMLKDADDMIENYPDLDKFVNDAPWIDVDSSNVNDIPGDEHSFKELMESFRNKMTNVPSNDVSPVKFIHLLLFLIFLPRRFEPFNINVKQCK